MKIRTLITMLMMMAVVAGYPGKVLAAFSADWENSADDGKKGYTHLGQWLVSNGYFAGQSAAENYAKTGYIGYDAGDADPYSWSLSEQFNVQIVQEIAGYRDLNTFGYYTGSDGAKVLSQVFSGTQSGPQTLSLGQPFGFYIGTPEFNTWFTDKTENASGKAQALIYELRSDAEWLIAWEDLDASTLRSDNDYNDMYVKVTVAAEPLGGALYGLGGGAFGWMAWRKRRKLVTNI